MFIPWSFGIFLALLWIFSGIDKLAHPREGVLIWRRLGLRAGAVPAIRGLGLLEALAGLAWVAAPRDALWVTLPLLAVYAAGMAWLVTRQAPVNCACGGLLGSDRISWLTVARAVLLMGITAVAGQVGPTPLWVAAGPSLPEAALAGTAVAGLMHVLSAISNLPSWDAPHA